jgi:CarD family transcriptional regulator
MQFSLGDKVVHPKFGAGAIVDEKHRELVEGYQHYFVIEILATGATAYVPVDSMSDLGVRRVMSPSKLAQVLATLQGVPIKLSKDYKKRQARVREKLDTAKPIQIAEAVRDLVWRRELKRLTQKDEALLARGIDFLASEMAVATDVPIFDARERIDKTLRGALNAGTGLTEEAKADDSKSATRSTTRATATA